MKFKLFGYDTEVYDIDYGEAIISPHTGNALEKISFDIQVIGKSKNSEVQGKIPNAKEGGMFSIDNDGEKKKEYKLANSSYSYSTNQQDENTVYKYTLNLEQIERLNIESLIIGDLEVFPYEYEERYENDNAIVINAKVKLTRDEAEKLDNIDNDTMYFDVVRKGISDSVLEMRFGQVIWSENEEFIKRELVLVEKVYDENEGTKNTLFEPQMGNMMKILAYTNNLNNELVDLLLSKQIATSDEIESIKDIARKNISKTRRNFFEVDDIDKFSTPYAPITLKYNKVNLRVKQEPVTHWLLLYLKYNYLSEIIDKLVAMG